MKRIWDMVKNYCSGTVYFSIVKTVKLRAFCNPKKWCHVAVEFSIPVPQAVKNEFAYFLVGDGDFSAGSAKATQRI